VSEPESKSQSPFSDLDGLYSTEKTIFEMALAFIDSEVLGSVRMTAGWSGNETFALTSLQVSRDAPNYTELEGNVIDDSEMPFSSEYVTSQMDLSRPNRGRSAEEIERDMIEMAQGHE
jgi:hypothetical protein